MRRKIVFFILALLSLLFIVYGRSGHYIFSPTQALAALALLFYLYKLSRSFKPKK